MTSENVEVEISAMQAVAANLDAVSEQLAQLKSTYDANIAPLLSRQVFGTDGNAGVIKSYVQAPIQNLSDCMGNASETFSSDGGFSDGLRSNSKMMQIADANSAAQTRFDELISDAECDLDA